MIPPYKKQRKLLARLFSAAEIDDDTQLSDAYFRNRNRNPRIFGDNEDVFLRGYLRELPLETDEPGREDWRDADEINDD